jgi:ribosomal protein S12 methylthiotransferase accessory factor
VTAGIGSIDQTLNSLLPRLESLGITRLADTTGLDTLAIPTASAVKPGTRDGLWVYSGKGTTQAQARLTAVMECLERTAALWPEEPDLTVSSHRDLRARGAEVWGPERFTERKRGYDRDTLIPWVTATRFSDRGTVWVPAHYVYASEATYTTCPSPFEATTTNGLGAHIDHDSALLHALLEVVERHNVSVAEVRASHGGFRSLANFAVKFGLDLQALGGFRDDVEIARTIDAATVPAVLQPILRCFAAAGLNLTIKQIPSHIGLPTFGVAAVEEIGFDAFLGCAGYGCGLTHEAALRAALLELAQTRATDLQGAREDRHVVEKSRLTAAPESHWLATPGRPQPFEERGAAPTTPRDGLHRATAALSAAGYGEWAYVRFPVYDGIHVCRVIVPGAETWHPTAGASDFGPALQGLSPSHSGEKNGTDQE